MIRAACHGMHFILLLAMAQPPATPAPTPAVAISLPKTITGAPGDLIPIVAESSAALVSWDATPGLRILNTHPADPACKSMVIHAKAGGTFAIFAAIPSDKGISSAVCVVTIGQPGPPPPPPVATFADKLEAAYTADIANGSTAAQAAKLVLLYRTTAASTVYDAGLTTGAGLLNEMHKAATTLIGDELSRSRRVIADELNKSFSGTKTLDKATRDAIAAAFVRIATALEGVK